MRHTLPQNRHKINKSLPLLPAFLWFLLNRHMRNYTADDIAESFKHYKQHIQYVIVAHTYHRPYTVCRNEGRLRTVNTEMWLARKHEQTSKDTRYALNCFNSLLYPNATNKCRRKPLLYRPLTFVTVEGARATTDRQQTIHINIAIGNLPKVLDKADVATLFRHAWHGKAQQSDDIEVLDYYEAHKGKGWLGYSLKEVQQQPSRVMNECSVWDVENCWIPHDAINAD